MEQPTAVQNPPTTPYATPDTPSPRFHRPRLWTPVGWKAHAIVASSLFLMIGATFSNSYQSGMALDNRYIIEEYYKTLFMRDPGHEVRSWRQVSYFFLYDYWWPKGISGLYRPITSFSYWIDYAFLTGKAPKREYDGSVPKDGQGMPIPDSAWAGMSWQQYAMAPGQLKTGSYHTINLLLHWTNALLIYFISMSLLNRIWPAAFVAALFAVHPITTESVTNIIGRADIFAAMSTFGGLLIYMRSTTAEGLGRAPWLILLSSVLFVGFLAKESSVAIGAIIPLYWITFKFDWSSLRRGFAAWAKPVGRELAVWCVMLPPLLGMLGLRAWVFANATPPEEPFLDNPIRGIWLYRSLGLESFEQQLIEKPLLGVNYIECKMTAVKIMGKLMALLAFPKTLCCDYSFDQIPNFSMTFSQGWDDWEAVLSLLVILGIFTLAGYLLYKGQKAAFFYIAFFFLAALPTSNFIITIGSVMAERFMYLPLMGFTGITVMGVFALGEFLWKRFRLDTNPDVPRYSLIAGELLSLVVVIYGVRAYMRNFVWKDDLTLWQDAIQTSPKSFRCYQSLAFALYERHMTQQKVDGREVSLDDIIKIDEAAIPITSKLPNHLNSSRLYLHLGMYYVLKGDYMCVKDPTTGDLVVPLAARPYYQRAVELLEIGSKIDRAFNEVNRAKQLQRNDPLDRITEVGLAPVYGVMGGAYDRLKMPEEALKRFEYQKQLDPMDLEPYTRIAGVRKMQKNFDLAAISLVEAMLLDTKQMALWQELANIYANMGPEGATTIVMEGNQPRLNVQGNNLAKEHLIQAYRDLIRVARRTKRFAMAEDAWTTAHLKHGFPRELFDPLFEEDIDIVTPQGITGKIPTPRWSATNPSK